MLRRQKGVTNLTTASASYTLVGRSMGGGEGDVPSSSDGLPNVGKGVADILVVFHQLSVLGVFGIVTDDAKSQILVCILFHMLRTFAEREKQ